jgi:prenyltransferase beta subunit
MMEAVDMRRVLLAGLCLLVVSVPIRAQTPDEKKATVAWLRKLQAADGGFQPAPGKAPSGLRATTTSLRALKYFGGEVPDQAACVEFVKSCFDKDSGGFADRPGGKPDVIATAIGVMAVIELKLSIDPYEAGTLRYLGEHSRGFEEIRLAAAGLEALGKRPPQADDWLKEITRMRHDDGTYGKGDGAARDTGSAVVAVLRLGGKVEHPEAIVKFLDAGQRKDGGFGKAGAAGSDLETTYRVVRCYHVLKARPAAADRCREFIASCRNRDGGYGVAPGEPSSAGGTYFAGIVLHWLDGK